LAPGAERHGGLGRALLAGSVSATLLLFGMATTASAQSGPTLTVDSPTPGAKITSTDIPVSVSVGGLACADKITVTLKFKDGQSQQVAVDGCRLLG